MNRLDDCIRRRGQEAIDEMRSRNRLGLRAAVPFELCSDSREGKQRPVLFQRKPGLWIGLRRILREAVGGTKHRFSGLSHIRQCGEEVLRMFVTGGPPVRGGDGIPHRIIAVSRPCPASRITGAG